MNSKLTMTVCAAILGIIGIILIFLPKETEIYLNLGNTKTIVFQILGALYFGFAMINWTSKENLIGGIYSRAIVIGNFTHFFIGSIFLIKFSIKQSSHTILIVVTFIYLISAITFGYFLFNNPELKTKEQDTEKINL